MTFDRRDAGSTTEPRRRVQWNLMRVLRAYISFSAKLNSNPGLRVSTFSRDARTPEATKAYRNSQQQFRADVRHLRRRCPPQGTGIRTSDLQPPRHRIRFQKRFDLESAPTKSLVSLPRFKPSNQAQSRQPHWRTLNRTQDFKFRHPVETRGPPEPRRS